MFHSPSELTIHAIASARNSKRRNIKFGVDRCLWILYALYFQHCKQKYARFNSCLGGFRWEKPIQIECEWRVKCIMYMQHVCPSELAGTRLMCRQIFMRLISIDIFAFHLLPCLCVSAEFVICWFCLRKMVAQFQLNCRRARAQIDIPMYWIHRPKYTHTLN